MLRVGTCIFQDLLKISTVVPVYEKDDNTNLSNYRLISLFLSMSKIFEKVILEQLFTYLEDNNLIHRQYGFKKHYSIDYVALHIVDYFYYKLDLKKIPINLYLLYRCISKRNKSQPLCTRIMFEYTLIYQSLMWFPFISAQRFWINI